jgi:predicted ATPase/DNA-binding winged helix-turn-helix (wHTH) protein
VEPETFVFGSFEFAPARRLLLHDGKPLTLGSRAQDILTILVGSAGTIVGNRQIMTHAWPDTHVEEGSLRVHIGALRKVLGDGRDGQRFIENIPGRGYVFVAPVSRPSVAPATPPPPVGFNVSRRLVNIVGRDETIANLAAQLARRRLLTIIGPGGIGKTTVASAVAESVAELFPDGVWFVPLASLADGDLVPGAVGAALGIATPGADPLPGLGAWLRDRRALIVLDNCEHVIETAASVAETLLRSAPEASILATSREPLRAEGESLHRLAPLTVPSASASMTADDALSHSAVRLFLERANASVGEISLTDADLAAVCEICRGLDGLPLALELAAVQVEVFGIQGLARGLTDRFALLTKGRRTALRRQQTLRATMDWSHDLLTPAEQVVLRRLSVFRGDFTIEAATSVAGDDALSDLDVIEIVADLGGKSLLATDISGEVTWHHLLETTRAYAAEKLADSGDADHPRRRHANYYRELFDSAEHDHQVLSPDEWIARYARHIDSLRAALDWTFSPNGDPALGVALSVAAVPLWIQLSLLSECRERAERALEILGGDSDVDAPARMRLLAALGWSLMYGVGRARETAAVWTSTLELAERLDDTTYRRHALWGLCIDQFNNGNTRTALSFAERFAALVDESDKPIERMKADRLLATSLHYLGDQTRANHHIEQALTHDTTLTSGSRSVSAGFDLLVSAHYFQARILWLRGFADRALGVVERNIEEGRLLDQALSFCSVLGQGACPIAFLAGDLDAAERYGAMLLDHTERHPVRLWNIWARCFLGLVTARRGEIESGTRALRDGLTEAGDARLLPRFLLLRGEQARYLAEQGEADEAIGIVDDMLAVCEARDEGWYIAELLRSKATLLLSHAGIAAADGAETLLRRSLDLAQSQGALAWELRTATDLARLWLGQGRAAEAGALLRPVRARFTEGFGTTDLRAAANLLETVRSG